MQNMNGRNSGCPTSATPSETALCTWLGAAAAGDCLAYYRGFLAIEIASEAQRLPDRDRRALSRVARRVRLLAEQGLAHLFQRRNGPGDFTYVLIAATRPRRVTEAFSLRAGTAGYQTPASFRSVPACSR